MSAALRQISISGLMVIWRAFLSVGLLYRSVSSIGYGAYLHKHIMDETGHFGAFSHHHRKNLAFWAVMGGLVPILSLGLYGPCESAPPGPMMGGQGDWPLADFREVTTP